MSDLVDRLRDYGLTLEENVIICDRRAVDEAAERIDELKAALDAKEIESGLTSNGNLWRFWSTKACDLAIKNVTLEAELQKAREALEKIVSTNQIREFMGDDANDGYGNQGWVVRDGQYAVIARAALSQDKEARE